MPCGIRHLGFDVAGVCVPAPWDALPHPLPQIRRAPSPPTLVELEHASRHRDVIQRVLIGSKSWWLALLLFVLAGVTVGLTSSARWPDHIELYLAIAACAGGFAFGARGTWLPLAGCIAFGAVWLIRMGPSTNPSTGDNEGAVVVFVILVASAASALLALAGAGLRRLLVLARQRSSTS